MFYFFDKIALFLHTHSVLKAQQPTVPTVGMPELPMIVIITAYNNRAYVQRTITSALEQHYNNYTIIYKDDCSNDGSLFCAYQIFKNHPQKQKITVQTHTNRILKLANLYQTIHAISYNTIVVELDGDDYLAHPDVLTTINYTYHATRALIVYANYTNNPPELVQKLKLSHFCYATPWLVTRFRLFRFYPWIYSGLRTYYAGLFKQIKYEDLVYTTPDGQSKFIPVCHDCAITYPMLEIASPRIAHISEPLLVRNIDSPLNDFKIYDQNTRTFIKNKIKKTARYQRMHFDF